MQHNPTKYSSAFRCFVSTVRYEGVTALFRGMMAPISTQCVINAIIFSTENLLFKELEKSNTEKSRYKEDLNHLVSGMVAGLAQCVVLVPSEVVKVNMQADEVVAGGKRKYSGSLNCMLHIVKTENIRGLYKGAAVTILREIPSIGIYFASYSTAKDRLQKAFGAKYSTLVTLIAGGISGVLCWGSIYPIDVVKTRIQISDSQGKARMLGVAKQMYRENGIGGFFAGFTPTMIRAFYVNGIVFLAYECAKELVGV